MEEKLLMITGDRALAAGKHGAFYNTIQELRRHWARIDIICPKTKNRRSGNQIFDNVFVHASPWPLICQPFWILREGFRILKTNNFQLTAHDYIMTVHEYPPFYNGIGTWLLWRRTHIPYMLEIMHIPGYPRAGSFKESVYKWMMRLFIRYDTKNALIIRIINQKETADFLIKSGVPGSKLRYIPALYIDLDIFKPSDTWSKKYDLIFIGRLVKNKGIELFLEAVKMMNASAVIVGEGPLSDAIRLKIKNYKLKIDMAGFVRDSFAVAGLLNQSRILVMPSYNEGGPRVVLEAMACGVPVLATPVGIVPDVIKDGVSGGIIKWNADDIVKIAHELLSNSEKYSLYIRNGLAIAKEFEKSRAVQRYADGIRGLVG